MQSVTANGIFKKKSEENPQHDVIIEVPEGDENTSPEEFQVETDFNDDYIEDSGSDQAPEAPESSGLKGFFSRTDHNKDRFDALEAKYDLLLNKIDKISTIKDEKKVNKYSHCWIKSPDFEAPFEPKHSIEDINGMKYVEMQFPKVKFTGISGFNSINVMDFLRSMTSAQKKCKLNEEQFLDVLASRTGPPAAHMINRWIDLKLTARIIYTRLFQLYHQIVDPIKTQQYLTNYKIPSNFGFNQILSEIDTLSSQAALIAPTESQQKSLQESYALSSLQKCLPVEASRHVNELIVKHIQRYGEQPKLEDITEDLIIMTPLLDSEIRNAKNHHFDSPRKLGMFPHLNKITSSTMPSAQDISKGNSNFKGNNHFKGGKRVNMIYSQEEEDMSDQSHQGRVMIAQTNNTPNRSGFKPNNNNRFKSNVTNGKYYCSLCGMNTHNSTSPRGCFSMMDDNFKQLMNIAPSFSSCTTCSQKLNKNLQHPMKYCPLRPKILEGYKSGQITPKGFFAKFLNNSK